MMDALKSVKLKLDTNVKAFHLIANQFAEMEESLVQNFVTQVVKLAVGKIA